MEITRFEDVIGHEEIISHMKAAVKSGRISHAYILTGPEGCGKNTLANLFAMTIMCEGEGDKPCGQCRACKKIMSGNHPDLIYVRHAKDGVLSVGEARDQIAKTAEIKPYESSKKVYIISDADMMTPDAQNAILKTIEEPPEYAVFLLLAVKAESFLPTIKSRCVTLSLHAIDKERIADYVSHEYALSEADANLVAAFAQGSIGMAKSAVSSDEFRLRLEEGVKFLSAMPDRSIKSCVEMAKAIAPTKEDLYAYFHIFTMWLRDVLYFKASNDPDGIVFKDRLSDIRRQAGKSSYEGIEKCLAALDTATARVRANVDREVVLELLFLTILENL